MSKHQRPSIISDLLSPPSESAPAADLGRNVTEFKLRARPDIVHSSIYVPKAAYRKLREIALARECKVHDLILDGIDTVLREHGHPTTAEFRAKVS